VLCARTPSGRAYGPEKMGIYSAFLAFSTLAIVFLGATLVVHGGMEAIAMGAVLLVGVPALVCFIVLMAASERPHSW
jgi:hypothetical protein